MEAATGSAGPRPGQQRGDRAVTPPGLGGGARRSRPGLTPGRQREPRLHRGGGVMRCPPPGPVAAAALGPGIPARPAQGPGLPRPSPAPPAQCQQRSPEPRCGAGGRGSAVRLPGGSALERSASALFRCPPPGCRFPRCGGALAAPGGQSRGRHAAAAARLAPCAPVPRSAGGRVYWRGAGLRPGGAGPGAAAGSPSRCVLSDGKFRLLPNNGLTLWSWFSFVRRARFAVCRPCPRAVLRGVLPADLPPPLENASVMK